MSVTAAQVRAMIAVKRAKQWELAFKLRVNPTQLNAILNERREDPDLLIRAMELLEQDDPSAA